MWTNIILGVVILLGMAYGFYLMFRVDIFAVEQQQLQEKESGSNEQKAKAILFGDKKRTADAKRWLESKKVEVICIEEICIRKDWEHVQWVVAMSSEDTENLSLCSLLRKMCQVEHIFSICNEKVNEAVYRRFDIQMLEKENLLSGQLDAAFTGKEVSIA